MNIQKIKIPLGMFFLFIAMKSFCGENQLLIQNNNDDNKTASGLRRDIYPDNKTFTFEYRSQENYNKNSCTRPLKKIVDYIFCENRDSYCIRNKVDPKECFSWCCSLGVTCGVLVGPITKYMAVGLFQDPQNIDRDFCSRCACDFAWFPSCYQQYSCPKSTDYGSGCCCASTSGSCVPQTMVWGSSCSLIPGCILLGCLALKECLKEKGKNERLDY